MRKINPQRLRLVALLLSGCILIGAVLFSMYRNHKNIQMLKNMEVYEVSFSYVQVEKRTEVHYMICEPPNDQESIREKVDTFLAEGNIVEALKLRSADLIKELNAVQEENQPLVGINLIFLEPSKDLNIGEFPNDIYDSKYHMGEHRVLTVSVSFISDDQYEIEYLWPRKST